MINQPYLFLGLSIMGGKAQAEGSLQSLRAPFAGWLEPTPSSYGSISEAVIKFFVSRKTRFASDCL